MQRGHKSLYCFGPNVPYVGFVDAHVTLHEFAVGGYKWAREETGSQVSGMCVYVVTSAAAFNYSIGHVFLVFLDHGHPSSFYKLRWE